MTMQSTSSSAQLSKARVNFFGVARSEWTKLVSIRSTYYVLGIAALFMIGLSVLIAFGISEGLRDAGGLIRAANMDEAIAGVAVWLSLQGTIMAQLAVGVLGVLVVTGEYSTGMIRATIAAVPSRIPVLLAKTLIVLVATLLIMVPAALVAFQLAKGVLADVDLQAQISDPGVLRAIIGVALYLCVVGVIGSALGWLLRSAAGAIFALVALLILLPILLPLVQLEWVQTLVDYLPSVAGQAVYAPATTVDILPSDFDFDGARFSPWEGFGIMVAWAVAALVGAGWMLMRRDA